MSTMTVTSHMWLFIFELIKIIYNYNSVPHVTLATFQALKSHIVNGYYHISIIAKNSIGLCCPRQWWNKNTEIDWVPESPQGKPHKSQCHLLVTILWAKNQLALFETFFSLGLMLLQLLVTLTSTISMIYL